MNGEINTQVTPLAALALPKQVEPRGGISAIPTAEEVADLGGKEVPVEEVSQEKVTKAVSRLNDYVQSVRRELRFSIDEVSGRTVITVLDAETQEVIRQIPPQEALMLSRHVGEGGGLILSARS